MDTILIINAKPEMEDELVDFLMELDCVGGFTSYEVRGYSRHGHMSVAEQVSGRRKRIQIELLLLAADVPEVLAGMGTRVGNDMVHWQQPVWGFGRIG